MEKSSISFIAMNLILLFVGIGFILIVFDLQGFAFLFELLLLLVFMFFLAFGMYSVYNNKKLGWAIIGATLILLLIDILFMFLLTGTFGAAHLITVLFSIIGLIVAIINFRGLSEEPGEAKDEYAKVSDYYSPIDKVEPKEKTESKEELKQEIKEEVKKELKEESREEPVKKEIKVKAKKTAPMPKFVGSAETKKFHTSKCGWSRLMKRKNKVFFNAKRRAIAAGFKAHECVQ